MFDEPDTHAIYEREHEDDHTKSPLIFFALIVAGFVLLACAVFGYAWR